MSLMDNKSMVLRHTPNFPLDASTSWDELTLRLDSPVYSSLLTSDPKGIKRNWDDIMVNASVALGFGCLRGSSNISKMSSTAISTVSSIRDTTDDESSLNLDLQLSLSTMPSQSTCSDESKNNRAKNCQFPGCGKLARGASRLCIAHGGGKRCQKAECQKGAEGRTMYCKAHGGGNRCQYINCIKSAGGRTDQCIAHGGGNRCSYKGCSRAGRGKSGLCIRHGGGKRCMRENCAKSADGQSGLCISHGGGRRCQFPECAKGAQGSTVFCKAHGGGKRCTVLGCTKGAEGSTALCKAHGGGKRCSFQGDIACTKSVHGGTGTQFGIAHGGGKRCAVADCTKSARGRTDYCVRHGGGKRCKYEGCAKSAQGSTDFCKAHGGGKQGFGTTENVVNHFSTTIKFEKADFKELLPKMERDWSSSMDWSGEDARVHGGCLMAMLSGSEDVEQIRA